MCNTTSPRLARTKTERECKQMSKNKMTIHKKAKIASKIQRLWESEIPKDDYRHLNYQAVLSLVESAMD